MPIDGSDGRRGHPRPRARGRRRLRRWFVRVPVCKSLRELPGGSILRLWLPRCPSPTAATVSGSNGLARAVVDCQCRGQNQMSSATIKLFLPLGDAKSLRTAEISNWTGKAVAAPRTELDELLAREELDKAGVYILTGNDPASNIPRAYIGEAEVIRERLKQHKAKEFWVSAIVFVSKDGRT